MAETRKIRNLNDLAERFGCTATTVSMALKNSPQLSSELREKIQAAATAGNFRPRNYTRRELQNPIHEHFRMWQFPPVQLHAP